MTDYTPGPRQAKAERPRASISPDHSYEPPKPWLKMTPEEKAAIWLGFYQGKTVQYSDRCRAWRDDPEFNPGNPVHDDQIAYRIKPVTKVHTIAIDGNGDVSVECQDDDKARITFDTVGGEIDYNSLRWADE